MTVSEAQQPGGTHLVLYDGVCGLCSHLLQFLVRHDRRRLFRFASLQSRFGQSVVERSGGNPRELSSFYVVENYDTSASRILKRSDAALFVAAALNGPWKLVARLMRVVPPAIRDRAYDVVARNRYRVFGRYEQCLVPSLELRRRFIDGSWS